MKFQSRLSQSLTGLATLALLLAACAPPAAQPVPQESTPIATPPAATEAPSAEQPATEQPAAVEAARAWLATHLGLAVEDISVVGQKEAEWPDGCLGLPQLGEACTEALVPGWAISLEANGQSYEVRTDATGATVRLVPAVVDSELAGTAWVLESFTTGDVVTSVVAPGSITLAFQPDGQAGGSGGCNSYGGPYQADAGSLTFGDIVSTLMACAEPDLMGQEAQYYTALQNASAYSLDGDVLTITHTGGTLTFARQSDTEPAAGARLPAIIDFHADGSEGVLTAPDTVAVGEDFEITVSTFGGGCESAGDTAVVIGAAGADVFVYDFTTATSPDVACEAILHRLTHTATLRFDQPGEMVIRVWGRQVGPETPAQGVPTVIEHTVTVQ